MIVIDSNVPMYLVGADLPHNADARPAFDVLLAAVDEVFAVDVEAVERARAIVLARPRLSARDALPVAVMERQGVSRILSFDAGFDGMPGIERLSA